MIYRVTLPNGETLHTGHGPLADVWLNRHGGKLERIPLASIKSVAAEMWDGSPLTAALISVDRLRAMLNGKTEQMDAMFKELGAWRAAFVRHDGLAYDPERDAIVHMDTGREYEDGDGLDAADAELARLRQIESAAELALGLLWMTEYRNGKVSAAFSALRDVFGSSGSKGLGKAIQRAIEAGHEADHPPGTDWWCGREPEGDEPPCNHFSGMQVLLTETGKAKLDAHAIPYTRAIKQIQNQINGDGGHIVDRIGPWYVAVDSTTSLPLCEIDIVMSTTNNSGERANHELR